jgi:hypothetical protein
MKMLKKDKPIVVCVTGYKQDGKTTTATLLKEHLEELGVVDIEFMNFADAIKSVAKKVFGITSEQLEELKQREFNNPLMLTDPHGSVITNKKVTMRNVLQDIGSQVALDLGDQNIWAKALYKHIKVSEAKLIFVSDLRFPNEVEYLEDKLGKNLLILRVDRGKGSLKGTDTHPSETSIDSIPYQLKIDNKGDLEGLKDTCGQIALFILGVLYANDETPNF